MTLVRQQIINASEAIEQNIESLTENRELLSQNMLQQLRNLVEGAAALIQSNEPDSVFDYNAIKSAKAFAKSTSKLKYLSQFHKLLQKSASHYTFNGDTSERLMLKYYEYLHRLRSLLEQECAIKVLNNLEKFPRNLDPGLQEYHQKIAQRIDTLRFANTNGRPDRYYIHKTRPFFVDRKIYYEVTFYRAINKVNKFNRVIAFTHIDITDKYAATLTLRRDAIEVLGQKMPITIIDDWEVSIRPCEFNKFARLLGENIQARTDSTEYRYLMRLLTSRSCNLIDLIDLPEEQYAKVQAIANSGNTKPLIFPVLNKARWIIQSGKAGSNVLRYLILRLHNQTIKAQYSPNNCDLLSNLHLKRECKPFYRMPFCTSLVRHNPTYWDLLESIDASKRKHEFMARRVANNVQRHGVLYTPLSDLKVFDNTDSLVEQYNQNLYRNHKYRQLIVDKEHVFIREHEDETTSIVNKIKEYTTTGIDGYTQAVERWFAETTGEIDDKSKKDVLKTLFSHSRVALIYGAAGTGKSTMLEHIARYFNDKKKLFLAHTNPAIDNLKRRITAQQNSEFRTISSHVNNPDAWWQAFDVLVLDECSTISNSLLLKVLNRAPFELLVLVGDVYQIESIEFGNWFAIIRSFVPKTAVFELTTPFRTKNQALLDFWSKVRELKDDIAESMAHNGYSSRLDETLFEAPHKNEIILCLNYDGLYGINNINRFLQNSNTQPAVDWRESIYKIGDPVLFHENERFKPVIYNNLKGKIVDIQQKTRGQIQFDIELDRPLSEIDIKNNELQWVRDSVVRFTVYDKGSDEDDDSLNTSVPFQVAYAVSIHKAQGLEYDSVKIVISNANEDDITHSIFYTAVTRARERLKVFWTPETQQRVLSRLQRRVNNKDVALLCNRRGLKPVDR